MGSNGRKHVIYQAMGAASVGMSGMAASLTMGYTSPALPSMQEDPNFTITEDDESWIGAVMPACALLGSLAAGPMLDSLGRRTTFMLLTLPFMISWAIIAIAGSVSGVILGRMLSGVCVGVQAVAGSVFMPETVQLDLRNAMIIFPTVLGNMGILVCYAAGQYFTWRGLAWLGCALCIPQLLLIFPLPETPFYLTRSGKKESSLAALKQLRQTSQEAEKEQLELDGICSKNKESNAGVMKMLQPPNLWPVSVGAALMVAQQTTGINAVIFYASAIFEAGGDSIDASTSSTLLGVVNLLGVFAGMYFVATYKRRQLIVMSTWVLVVSLSILSAFFWAQEMGGTFSTAAKSLSFIPVVALLSYIVGFALGWGPVPWIFLGEGMPSSVRGIAVAFIVALNWGMAFLVTKTFKWSTSYLGNHYTFFTYAIVTGISGALIHRSMPETYQQSNVQMDNLYLKASKIKEN